MTDGKINLTTLRQLLLQHICPVERSTFRTETTCNRLTNSSHMTRINRLTLTCNGNTQSYGVHISTLSVQFNVRLMLLLNFRVFRVRVKL